MTSVDGEWCIVKKFSGPQLRNTSYKVNQRECIRVPSSTCVPPHGKLSPNEEVDDVSHEVHQDEDSTQSPSLIDNPNDMNIANQIPQSSQVPTPPIDNIPAELSEPLESVETITPSDESVVHTEQPTATSVHDDAANSTQSDTSTANRYQTKTE